MPAVGELVQSISGQWIARPPLRCPRGHPIRPGHVLVGSIACSCGRHLTWSCDSGNVTYDQGVTIHAIYAQDPDDVAQQIAKQQQLQTLRYNGRPWQ